MKRFLFLALLAVAAALAFALRADTRGSDPGARGSRYADLDDSESAYRLRLVELLLVGNSTPEHDGFLDVERTPTPWPPLVHRMLGSAAATFLERDPRRAELDGFDEESLIGLARAVGPGLGAIATLLVALATSFAFRGRSGERAAIAAAFAYALLPLAISRESSGALHAHPWVSVLLAVEFAAFAIVVRAAERIDMTLGALGVGFTAGLAQLAGPEAWPVSVSIAVALAVLAARSPKALRRDGWRAVLLAVGGALAVMGISEPSLSSARLLPDFSRGAQGLLGASVVTQLVVALALCVALASLVRERAEPLRAVLLAATLPSAACALFDARFFAPLAVVLAIALGGVFAGSSVTPSRAREFTWSAAACGFAFALAFGLQAARLAPSNVAARQALLWLRDHSSSPGPFNHGEGRQSWRVAAPPQLAGSIAFHARRGVLASSFDGVSSASCERLAELFQSRDLPSLAVELAKADCPILVLTPRMLSDPTLGIPSGGAIETLALGDADSPSPEFTRVFATARRELRDGSPATEADPGAPSLSIYRRVTSRDAPPSDAPSNGPTMRRDG